MFLLEAIKIQLTVAFHYPAKHLIFAELNYTWTISEIINIYYFNLKEKLIYLKLRIV